MPDRYRAAIECQACGARLRELTPKEAQEVAHRPYDFVVYCAKKDCQEMALHGRGSLG